MARTTAATDAPLRRYTCFSFKGGLDLKSSPQELATNARLADRLTAANNTVYLKSGAASKRYDITTYNSATVGASTKCIGGYQFRMSTGTDTNVAAFNDGTVRTLNTDGTTTTLKSGLSAATQAFFCQFGDLLIYTDRVNAAQQYDGTTWGALTGTPPATPGPAVTHMNRVLMLDAGNDRRISWSKLGDPQNYTAANDAGSVIITGRFSSPLMTLLPMTNELLILQRDVVTRLQGTAPSTYAITNAVPAQTSIGAISRQGAVFGNNDAWWISQRGIHNLATTFNFGDLVESFASERIDPYFVPNSGSTLSLNQLGSAVSTYDSQNNRLFFGVDTNNDGNCDTLFVFDLYTKGWSVWPSVPGTSFSALWTAYTGTNGVEVFMGGTDGFVRRLNVNASTNAIAWSFKHLSALGAPTVVKSPRYLMVYLAEQGATTITVTTTADFGLSSGASYSVSQLGNAALLGSSFVLGTSVLGRQTQIKKRVDTSGVGEFWEVQFANSQAGVNSTVHGYEWLWRERRQIPPQS